MSDNSEGGPGRARSRIDFPMVTGWIVLAAVVLGGFKVLLHYERKEWERADENVQAACTESVDALASEVEKLRKGVVLLVHYQPDIVPEFAKAEPLTGLPRNQIQDALCEVANDEVDPNTSVCAGNARYITRPEIIERLTPKEPRSD